MYRKTFIAALVALVSLGIIGWDSLQDGIIEPQLVLSAPQSSIASSPSAASSANANDVLSSANTPIAVDARNQPLQIYAYVPSNATARQPLQVVIALHGMGGEGRGFAASLIREAERQGWLLIGPTIKYGDWHNPDQVVNEDIENTQRLLVTINELPLRTGFKLKPRVDVYGFSRGAQLAHRFALFFPDYVDSVAAFSAGTYTLPYRVKDVDSDGHPDIIVLPYGVADANKRLGHPVNLAHLKQVRFLIGVGGADTAASDVPRSWDPYLGKTRVERALVFASALQGAGVSCQLQLFPGVAHELTANMLSAAVQFFSGGDALALASNSN